MNGTDDPYGDILSELSEEAGRASASVLIWIKLEQCKPRLSSHDWNTHESHDICGEMVGREQEVQRALRLSERGGSPQRVIGRLIHVGDLGRSDASCICALSSFGCVPSALILHVFRRSSRSCPGCVWGKQSLQ